MLRRLNFKEAGSKRFRGRSRERFNKNGKFNARIRKENLRLEAVRKERRKIALEAQLNVNMAAAHPGMEDGDGERPQEPFCLFSIVCFSYFKTCILQ